MSTDPMPKIGQLVKSKQRVADHGEVFTPAHTVEAMLDLVRDESERIDSRVLEPACGEGNFLKQVLVRKLNTVQANYSRSEFERRHYALLGLMCIYGIELLEDNVQTCRGNLAEIFTLFVNDPTDTYWEQAARAVLDENIVHADALTMTHPDGTNIVFPEWGYVGKGKYQRRDFEYSELTERSIFVNTLLDPRENDEIFAPKTIYPAFTVQKLAESRQQS